MSRFGSIVAQIEVAEIQHPVTLTAMHKLTLACGLLVSPIASAKIARRAYSPFDFSQARAADDKVPSKSLLHRILYRVDGGGLHGIPQADMTSHKLVDPISAMTIRVKFHY
jgi:hypothetical protein